VLLYAYALRIYFDFAGYTDIALGLGRWLGVRLPENFSAPYLKTNMTAFWNSWHITLAQWFRAYFFNPATRVLRSSSARLPVWLVILVGQAGTMLLIGLWHGVTWNFAAWGLWHAAGLFAHNRWSDWMRPRMTTLEQHPTLRRLGSLAGWLLTFHYVTLGWVWFVLPDIRLSLLVFQKLFSH
jgi:D-alanyl-lipoteichoic acid acyltransferase DltB (MBOAT superfamily)